MGSPGTRSRGLGQGHVTCPLSRGWCAAAAWSGAEGSGSRGSRVSPGACQPGSPGSSGAAGGWAAASSTGGGATPAPSRSSPAGPGTIQTQGGGGGSAFIGQSRGCRRRWSPAPTSILHPRAGGGGPAGARAPERTHSVPRRSRSLRPCPARGAPPPARRSPGLPPARSAHRRLWTTVQAAGGGARPGGRAWPGSRAAAGGRRPLWTVRAAREARTADPEAESTRRGERRPTWRRTSRQVLSPDRAGGASQDRARSAVCLALLRSRAQGPEGCWLQTLTLGGTRCHCGRADFSGGNLPNTFLSPQRSSAPAAPTARRGQFASGPLHRTSRLSLGCTL